MNQILVRHLCCATLLLTSTHLHAKSGDDAPLEQVVVSVTRVPQPDITVAAADTARTVNNDATAGIQLSDHVKSMAGVLVRDRQNHAQDQQLSIRGFGARAQFGIVGVRLYVDGIPATMPDGQAQATHLDFNAAERIEVLRGPYSVLYGNAAGGVVQLFTARGTTNTTLRTTVQGGSFNTWRGSLNASGTLGGMAYNADYTHFVTDGTRDHSHARRELGNLRLDFTPFNNNELMIVVNHVTSPEAQDNGSLKRAEFDANPDQAAPNNLLMNSRKSTRQTQLGLTDVQYWQDTSLHVMAYGGQREITQILSTPPDPQTLPRSAGGVVDLDNTFAGMDVHVRHEQAFDQPLTLLGGTSYERLHSHRRGYQSFVGAENGVIGALRRDEINLLHNFDQYAQAEWKPVNKWTFSGGVRHNAVYFDSRDFYITGLSNNDDSGSRSFNAWTYALSAGWQVNDLMLLYANYGRALDTPTFDNLAYRPDGSSGLNLDLQAAHTNNYELGFKWQRDNLSLRAALFDARTDNEIGVASASGGRTTFRNIGPTERRGLELETSWQFADHWRTQWAYTWLDAQFKSGAFSGNRIPGIARSVLHGDLRWDASPAWYVAMGSSVFSRTAVNDNNNDFAPGYALVDLKTGYTLSNAQSGDHWQAAVSVRIDNLLDRNYVSGVVINDANSRFFQPGAGRSMTAGVQLKWRQP